MIVPIERPMGDAGGIRKLSFLDFYHSWKNEFEEAEKAGSYQLKYKWLGHRAAGRTGTGNQRAPIVESFDFFKVGKMYFKRIFKKEKLRIIFKYKFA